MNKFKHLVKHGLKKRIKTKAFLISNIIIGIVILGITLIPTIINQFSGDELPKQVVTNLVLVNNSSNSDIDINLENMINSYNTSAEIVVFNYTVLDNLDIEAFYNEENDYHAAIIISEVDDVYVLTIENKRLDSSVQSYLQAILPELNRYQFLIDHDEYENQISNTLIEFKKDPSLGDSTGQELLFGIAPMFIVPILMLIVFGIQYVGVDIIEEKSTKAIEVIISSVKPSIHFLSKITYVLLFLLVQLGLLVGVSLIGLLINSFIVGFGSWDVLLLSLGDADLFGAILITIITSVLGTLLYMIIASFIASIAVNQEDFQQIQTPMVILVMFGYLGAMLAAVSQSQVFILVLSYIPFTSPFMLPVAYFSGTIGLFEVILSIALIAGTIVGVAYIFAPLYRASILNYDQSKLWRRIKNSFRNAKSLRKQNNDAKS